MDKKWEQADLELVVIFELRIKQSCKGKALVVSLTWRPGMTA